MNDTSIACDVLVIGGGGAGVIAAIEASQQPDLKTVLVSKETVGQSGLTPTANGGTRAFGTADDMFSEVVLGGCFLSDQNIVWHVVNRIKSDLEELKKLGVDVIPLSPTSACVHGVEALKRLRQVVKSKNNIKLLEDVMVTSLLKSGDEVSGATALDLKTGEFFTIQCKAVVLATGGLAGELYPHTSNNPFGITTEILTGTGHMMAYDLGAELIDIELIQFVPLPANPRCMHLRYFPEFWAGPYVNGNGETIATDVNLYRESGRGSSYSFTFVQALRRQIEAGKGSVYIDRRGLTNQHSNIKYPPYERRRKAIKILGIDPLENRIEITVGSHMCLGGIRTNEKMETVVPGLFVAGEVVGGFHGGMRTSGCFHEMITTGFECGKQAAGYASKKQQPQAGLSASSINAEKEKIFKFLEPKNNAVSIDDLKRRLKEVMQKHVFVFRDKAGLEEALKQIKAIKDDVKRVHAGGSKRYNLEWIRSIEFTSLTEAAQIVAESALARQESRGFQYRADFPAEDNTNWLKHTLVKKAGESRQISTAPVIINRMKPEAKI